MDRDKVDDALVMTELTESNVYDISGSEYVRNVVVYGSQGVGRNRFVASIPIRIGSLSLIFNRFI
ncbi:hypothetical protein [Natrinema pallidum]|uniref:hypothetical protein n=1 Tax=Natrinema pallidum TaxID=69527 RepID=UPI0012680B2D|nr:hypothetical protein [Natrinema pallidum]